MKFNRRTLIGISAIGLTGTIAGCTDDTSVSDPDSEGSDSEGSDSEGSDSEGSDSEGSDSEGSNTSQTFELGETAVFSDGEGELSFTPLSASFHDVLVSNDYGNRISTETPSSGDTFLVIEYEAENTGSGTIDTPRQPVLVLDENQYDTNGYFEYDELREGVSQNGKLIYPVEYSEATASLIAEFTTFGDDATATWEFDTSALDRETIDYSDLDLGEEASLTADNRGYSVSVLNVEETQSYDYSSGDFEYTQEPDDGNKYVLVTVRAENTGSESVSVTSSRDFKLVAGSSQYERQFYRKESEEYEGGEIAAGVEREGVVLFELPESTSTYTIQADLTDDISASWSV